MDFKARQKSANALAKAKARRVTAQFRAVAREIEKLASMMDAGSSSQAVVRTLAAMVKIHGNTKNPIYSRNILPALGRAAGSVIPMVR